jgi:hypothetical protein
MTHRQRGPGVPDVYPLGDALLLQGPAVADAAYLVGLGLRYRKHIDGAQPTVHHRRLLAALTDAAMSAAPRLRGNPQPGQGHGDVPASADPSQSDVEWVATSAAADLLGLTSRQVRRLTEELGARRIKGAWFFNLAAVTAEAHRRKEHHPHD